MNDLEALRRRPSRGKGIGCWAYLAVAVLTVTGLFVTAALGAGAYLFLHGAHQRHSMAASSSVIVRSPSFMAGPAIEMSLPAGCDLASSSVDADGGNWWYENGADGHIHLLIAASRITGQPPQLSDAYFQRVMRIVERSGGDEITEMDPVRGVRVGSYDGREADYDVAGANGAIERAAALLIRRESDDLLIILYGDSQVRAEVDDAGRKMFDSLHPRPTPERYDLHSAGAAEPRQRRGPDDNA